MRQVCDALTRAEQPLCGACLVQPQLAVAVLQSRAAGLETAYACLVQVGEGALLLRRRSTRGRGTSRSQPLPEGVAPAMMLAPSSRPDGEPTPFGVAVLGIVTSAHLGLCAQICLHCGGGGGRPAVAGPGGVVCDSLDCAVYFERRKAAWEGATARAQLDAALAVLPT